MYNEFYGFSQKPFEVAPDPKFLYFTSSHWDALDAMMKGIKTRQGFISITGEVGTGKTTLIHSVLTNLDEKVKTAFIFHTLITFEELLGSVLRELYLEVTGKDKKTLLNQLVKYLSHLGNDEMVAVIIDEAHLLATETLQELGKLHDLGPLVSERLQIVFVGQPEFKNILDSPNLKILNQRIGVRREIKALTVEETRDYIEYRLKLVGGSTSDTFTPQAISEITKYAKGIPRVINIVCDNAFLVGFSESKKKIDAKFILDVINNLQGPSQRQFKPMRAFSFMKRIPPIRPLTSKQIAAILLFLLVAGGIIFVAKGFLRYGPSERQDIASLWTSVFHNERPLITAPQTATTRTSKVDVQEPPVERRMLPVESPQPAGAPSAASLRMSGPTEVVIVKKGQSISRLAADHYGTSNTTRADLILDSNPEIINAHVVSVNQKIRIPKITERSLIIPSSDHTYKIIVGTFSSPEFARLYRAEPSLKGKKIEVVARKAAPNETWYRIVVGKFYSTDEALKVISVLRERSLLPLFGVAPKLK